MGIRHPIISEIAPETYLINEFGLCNHYLLVGSERALLIDCGMGYYDLLGTIASLTDKPYDVVITHGHPDHAGMMHLFDQVYMNEKDLPMLPWADSCGACGLYIKVFWEMSSGNTPSSCTGMQKNIIGNYGNCNKFVTK